MIGKLTGVIDSVGEDALILDVNGVGYRVSCSARTLTHIERPGARLSLLIETHVREDEIRLFGFESEAERAWFKALQSVQGVGAKVALGILGTLGPGDLARAVMFGDKAMVARAQGVGPKLAQRIVTELKDRAPAGGIVVDGGKAAPAPENAAMQDALSALVNLGYGQSDAARALALAAGAGAAQDVAVLVRAGLKELGR
jgi:Holliday junction DNA helicase RuvA